MFPLRPLPFCGARVAAPHAARLHVRNQYGAAWADAVDYGDNRLLKRWTCHAAHAAGWGALLFGGPGEADEGEQQGQHGPGLLGTAMAGGRPALATEIKIAPVKP